MMFLILFIKKCFVGSTYLLILLSFVSLQKPVEEKKIYAILYKNNEAIMKLDDLTNKVRANFEQHIDHAKESPFFKKFADKFFKDFDIDSPDFSAKSAITGLKDRVEDNLFKHLGKDDGMGMDPASLKELQKIIDNKDQPTSVQVRNTQKFKL